MAVEKEIIINANPFETRVALVEDGSLAEFYVERATERTITGNIYKGRVVRVLPGMQSAFVNLGLQRTAFLHIRDVKEAPVEAADELDETEKVRGPSRIQDILTDGQDIMVQVTKEPMGTKGARVTSYISLAGRYFVLMPNYDRVAISRRITDEKERRRLKSIVQSMRPEGVGFIIRTVCEGMKEEEIRADMEYLIKLWKGIKARMETLPSPALLYAELDLVLRTVRDLFTSDVKKLVVDSREEYERILKFIEEFMPSLSGRVELYTGVEGIFDVYGIEIELASALERKVWLRSGGFLIIDEMEALTAIDVNTGKYVGKKSSEQTIVKTNLEAVTEIVAQLRLRNIGGIIVIDFIDMARAKDRERVYGALKEALKADKARTNILKISELGIVEMTRKRVRESLLHSLAESCPYCEGNGMIKSAFTVMMEIYRELKRALAGERDRAVLFCGPPIAQKFEENREFLEDLETRFHKKIIVKPVERFHQERFEIF